MKKASLNTRPAKWWVFAALVAVISFTGCKKQLKEDLKADKEVVLEPTSAPDGGGDIPYVEGTIILGQPNLNPYTVNNMQTAYTEVTNNGHISNEPVNIRATHYYVKFKPENMEQYEELTSDSTLSFLDYPIESTILQNGNRYHDPSLPDSIPTYQYTAVPANYQFNSAIPYDIIDDLYIPEEDAELIGQGENNETYIDHLLDQAFIQTGNYEDTVKDYSQRTAANAKYTPGGRIRITDTRLNQLIGMEGVRITARRWFRVLNAVTDVNGNYRMHYRFNRRANFSLWFTNGRFVVRESLFGQNCYINGPRQTADWNHDITDGYDRFVGHVFRGAYRYHHKDIGGLERPWRPIGRQNYLAKNSHKGNGSGFTLGINWLFLPSIKIWRFRNAEEVVEFGSDEIFSTTCHETGHTSHALRMVGGMHDYIRVTRQIQESWATAIEWFITHIEYAERGIANDGEWNYHPANNWPLEPNDQGYQYWNPNDFGGRYTSLFIDIVDDINQLGQFFQPWGFGIVNDRVTGYSLPFIEQNILKNSYNLNTLRNELKATKPTGITDALIDELIANF